MAHSTLNRAVSRPPGARWGRLSIGAALALLAAAGGAALASGCSSGTGSRASLAASPQPPSFAAVAAAVSPDVALIQTKSGLGSGVVVDARGDVVTNAHVVAGGGPYTVQLGTSAVAQPATLLGDFPPDDLAVLRIIGAKNLKPAKIGGAGSLRVGEWVIAIGNPLGLTNTVTVGVVSALGREVSEPPTASTASAVLPDSIQTSAPINPGNSGGALVNLAGQVVGITTLGASGTLNSGAVITGIGFAIPSTIVNDITGQIIRYGRVVNSHRADLGLSGSSITSAAGVPVGVAVGAVTPDGPAAQAGILVGDLVTAVAGTPTPTAERLAEVLADQQPGKRVPVQLTDSTGAARSVSVVLGTLPS